MKKTINRKTSEIRIDNELYEALQKYQSELHLRDGKKTTIKKLTESAIKIMINLGK